MLGEQFFHDRKINELQFSRIAQQYQEAIFLPEGIAELAAVFTISHGMDISEAINRKWYKRRTGYFGPEIKIFRNFPLKYITHCFINDPNSPAGEIAKFLYQKKILSVEPIIDRFFHKDIFRRFYIEHMGISI